jgi:hypothetical protein
MFGLMSGLVGGLVFGLFWMVRSAWRPLCQAIQPIEMLQWSWRSSRGAALRGLGVGLAVGVVLGLVFGLSGALPRELSDAMLGEPSPGLFGGWRWGPIAALVVGLMGGLLGGLFGGFRPGIGDVKTIPNQGIWLSLVHAFRTGGRTVPIMALPPGVLLFGFLLENVVEVGLASAVIVPLVVGLWFGGLEVVEHVILRHIIVNRGHAPRNYARFLDYAAEELNFLQKVGGGYMFIHRYLLEYFAGLEEGGKRESQLFAGQDQDNGNSKEH